MPQTNLALKLEDSEEDYCYPHLIDDSDKISPDNIVQFHSLTSPAGMRTSVGLADNSQIGYQYDNLNRLIDETKTLSDTTEDYFNQYTFDAVGNRLTQTKTEKIEPTIGTADFDPNTLNVNSSGNFATVYLTPIPDVSDEVWIIQINENDIHPIKAEKIESDNVKFNRRIVAEISKDYVGQKVTYTLIWQVGEKLYQGTSDSIRVIQKGKPSKKPVPPPTTDLPPSLVTNITTTYAYNEENQLLSANDINYDYDSNGNLVRKDNSEGVIDYSWDNENRLMGIEYPDGTSDSYTYDGVGKRIQTNENGVIKNYLYDGLNAIIEQDSTGLTTASYVRGLGYGGGIGSIISASGNYYYYDGIGNVVDIADNAGNVTQKFVYDAYGNILNDAVPSPHGFSTKEYSSRSELIHFGARLYDSSVGRFISKDPYTWGPDDPRILAKPNKSIREFIVLSIGANNPQLQHPYVYCSNSPVNFVDPEGKVVVIPLWLIEAVNWVIQNRDKLEFVKDALEKAYDNFRDWQEESYEPQPVKPVKPMPVPVPQPPTPEPVEPIPPEDSEIGKPKP